MKQLIKTTLLIFLIITFSTTLFGQRKDKNKLVNLNTKFTLKLSTSDSITFDFKIKNRKPYNQLIDLMNTETLLDDIIEKDEIQGILSFGKFGDKTNIFLVLKSGIPKSLKYSLKIKETGKDKVVPTSTVDLNQNVITTELWPYQIEFVSFSNFKTFEQEEYSFLEPKIDSSCIKNSQYNIYWADSIFSTYLDTLNNCFLKPTGLQLNTVIDFEQAINSENITRDYVTGIGEGIYPNEKRFELDKLIRYGRLECPYFKTEIGYYCTKMNESVKVILFEWNEFRERDGIFDEGMNIVEKRKVFRDKFNKIESKLTNLLGRAVFIDMQSEKDSEKFRDGVKWKSKGGVRAYLFMFGNDSNKYRQIRLAIYKY